MTVIPAEAGIQGIQEQRPAGRFLLQRLGFPPPRE
jgi:hypothetical protein